MSASNGTRRKAQDVERLTAEVEALKARLAALEGSAPSGNGHAGPQTRRDLLKMAGAAVAGAAGVALVRNVPAAAAGNPIIMGPNTANDPTVVTDINPSSAASVAPLFEATGQGVSTTTNVAPFASQTGPASQTIPLIGAIGPGGALPQIGNPAQPDYPGFAPIQGIGGQTKYSYVPSVGAPPVNVYASEGLAGWGSITVPPADGGGNNGIGVIGESDAGFGVVGGSGGIDIAAMGGGRILQLALPDTDLFATPAGPPTYANPNDFEQVRDGNGILWMSGPGGSWRRANTVRVDTPDGKGVFAPVRIVDTRSASPALNWGHPGPLAPNTSYSFGPINGAYGLPSDVIGIVGNLTAVAAVGPTGGNGLPTFKAQGFLTIYPKGVAQPNVSNVNFGGAIYAWPNAFTVGLGTGANQGWFTIYVFNEAVNVVVDVFAYIQ